MKRVFIAAILLLAATTAWGQGYYHSPTTSGGGAPYNGEIGGTTPNQGTFTNTYLSSTDVTHGITSLLTTNQYGAMFKISSTLGGVDYYGLTDGDAAGGALRFTGVVGTTNPTDLYPVVQFRAGKQNGTGWQALGAAETAFAFYNYTTGIGTAYGNGEWILTSLQNTPIGSTIASSAIFTTATIGSLAYPTTGVAYTIPVFSATNTWGTVAAGTTGQILTATTGAAPAWSSSLSIATLDLTLSTSSVPMPVNTTTTELTTAGSMHYESDADILSIGDGATDIDLTFTPATAIVFPAASGTLQTVKNEKLASFAWDGGGAAVATASSKRCTIFPSAATIVGVYAMADASTTSHLHVYQDAFAAGARATTVTGAVDIGATLGSLDTTLTSWDKSITAGDEICISVESNDNAKWINVIVYGTR